MEELLIGTQFAMQIKLLYNLVSLSKEKIMHL